MKAPAARAWARLRLFRCARVGRDVIVRGRVWVHGGGKVVIGDRVVLDASTAPIELHAEPGAELILDDDVHICGGASLEAQRRIVVGRGSRIGPFAKVLDNHFHPVAGDRHARPASVEVVLEEGVSLGARSIVLPGAHLGVGAEVGPDSVISRRVPAGATVIGNPPKRVQREQSA